MAVKKIPNGEYYYFNREGNTEMPVLETKRKKGKISITSLLFPSEFIGKKVRLKVIPVDDMELTDGNNDK